MAEVQNDVSAPGVSQWITHAKKPFTRKLKGRYHTWKKKTKPKQNTKPVKITLFLLIPEILFL